MKLMLITEKITTAFTPTTLQIRNDSHLHSHHAAMADSISSETHFQYAFCPCPCPCPCSHVAPLPVAPVISYKYEFQWLGDMLTGRCE